MCRKKKKIIITKKEIDSHHTFKILFFLKGEKAKLSSFEVRVKYGEAREKYGELRGKCDEVQGVCESRFFLPRFFYVKEKNCSNKDGLHGGSSCRTRFDILLLRTIFCFSFNRKGFKKYSFKKST